MTNLSTYTSFPSFTFTLASRSLFLDCYNGAHAQELSLTHASKSAEWNLTIGVDSK